MGVRSIYLMMQAVVSLNVKFPKEELYVFSPELYAHCLRVADYAMILFECAVLTKHFYCVEIEGKYLPEQIKFAMQYHDAGKMAIPPHVLNKAGKLTEEEWGIMRRHPEYGAAMTDHDFTADFQWDEGTRQLVRSVAMQHHERWDGLGYPGQMKEREISIWARLCAIADTYDAITSCRVYRGAQGHEHASQVIRSQAGKQFDPEWVKVFSLCEDKFVRYLRRELAAS